MIRNNTANVGGGGLLNLGLASLNNVAFLSNSASIGGGLDNEGILTVQNGTFESNTAYDGGAVLGRGTGTTLMDSTLSGNSAQYFGGAIDNPSGSLTVTGSTLSGNSAGNGGGLFNEGSARLINDTLSGNHAGIGGPGAAGGGIENHGTLSVTDVTLSGNSANVGGGIENLGSLTAQASLFANADGGNLDNSHGTFVSQGHNLFSDQPDAALLPTDLVNTDPRLGPLADHGGPTKTQALLPGSPAIRAGVSVPGVTTDQRGVQRPLLGPDIGAFQVETEAPRVESLQRFGIHAQPTRLVLTFSGPLAPGPATDWTNYQLVRRRARRADRRERRPVHSRGGREVRRDDPDGDPGPLALLSLRQRYQLTINGQPPRGLRSPSGAFLAGNTSGQQGTNDFVNFGREALVVPGGPPVQGRTAHPQPIRMTGRIRRG